MVYFSACLLNLAQGLHRTVPIFLGHAADFQGWPAIPTSREGLEPGFAALFPELRELRIRQAQSRLAGPLLFSCFAMEPTSPPRRLAWRPDWRAVWDSPRKLLALVLAIVFGALLFFGFSWSRCFFTTCPNVAKLAGFQPGGAPVLLDRHGEAFADLAPAERRIVPLSSLPSLVPQAFLAVEDQRFYEHRGVDWRRVGGAVLADLRARGFAQGFSTISMQLARNVFPERLPGDEQTTRRKLLEIRVAQEIESRYSKEEILELYLNNIYFGNRARGIEAAARQYFGVSAKELTLPQAALLAALPKAPSHYDPIRHPDEALARRNLVLTLMQGQGRIPRYLAEKAKLEPLRLVAAPRQEKVESGLAPYFVEQVRHELEERFGSNLYTRPLRIVTTLDSAAQRAAEEELRRQLKQIESGDLGAFHGTRYAPDAPPVPTDTLQGAVIMLDAHDGDVLAWVGGRDFAQSQFDRVVQARRQPGSAFKPFVYAAALAGGWVLSQPLLDQPFSVRMASGKTWQPKNFADRYDGQVTMRDALVRSKNVPTVHLADAVGLARVTEMAHRAGIAEPIAPVPAIALGTTAVSPLEITAAYTGFASLGQAVEPRLILRVEDEKGKVIWQSQPKRHAALDPGVAFLVTDVLVQSIVSGTGSLVQQTGLKAPAAGKTGTTNDGADAWFVGYTPEIAGGVWIGFDKPRPILGDATGGQLAAPVWGRMLARVYQGRPAPQPWKAPANVVSHWIDPPTGLVIKEGCAPVRGFARPELFLKGKEPAAYCPGHETPPANGFPTDRRLPGLQGQTRQVAQAAADEEKKREQERLAQLADQERRQRAAEAAVQAVEKERAALKAREDRVAREELAVGRREAEIAKAERDRQAQQAAQRAAAQEAVAREAAAARTERLRQSPSRPSRPPRDDEGAGEIAEREPRPGDEERGGGRWSERATPAPSDSDLSGWWELSNTIASTNYSAYRGLRLGYRVQFEQDGDRLIGRGQKWSEDGRPVSAGARSPITVTGRVAGRQVILQFTEQGARRATTGSFSWTLTTDGDALRGSFWSTAADASGPSSARRLR
jgi:1A family penicillin-binding protein